MAGDREELAISSERRRAAIVALAVVAFAITYNGRLDGPLDLYHEGERLAHVDTLLAGGLPFRDVYVPHGLGEDIIKPLAARWLFGDSVAGLRSLGQNNYIYRGLLPPLGAVSIVLAAAAITRSLAAAGIACALVCLGLYEISERHVLGLLSIASLAMFMHRQSQRALVAAGLLAALAGLYSLEVGLYAIAVALAWIPFNAWLQAKAPVEQAAGQTGLSIGTTNSILRQLMLFLAGVAIALTPFVAWAAWQGILDSVWSNFAMQLFKRKELYPVSYPLPSWMGDQSWLDNVRVAGGTLLIFYAIPISYVVAIFLAWSQSGDRAARSRVMLAALTGAAFWVTVMGRADLWHAAFSCAGYFVFVATICVCPGGLGKRRFVRRAFLAMVTATVTANLWIGQWGAIGRNWAGVECAFLPPHLRSEGRALRATGIPRLGAMKIPADQADYLEAVIGYIQSRTTPEESILDLSDQGLLYYLAERRRPTRFAFVNYCGTPALRAEMVAEVTRHSPLPAYVIRYTTDVSTPDTLGAFVDRYYRDEVRIGPIVLLRRIGSAEPDATVEGDL